MVKSLAKVLCRKRFLVLAYEHGLQRASQSSFFVIFYGFSFKSKTPSEPPCSHPHHITTTAPTSHICTIPYHDGVLVQYPAHLMSERIPLHATISHPSPTLPGLHHTPYPPFQAPTPAPYGTVPQWRPNGVPSRLTRTHTLPAAPGGVSPSHARPS